MDMQMVVFVTITFARLEIGSVMHYSKNQHKILDRTKPNCNS